MAGGNGLMKPKDWMLTHKWKLNCPQIIKIAYAVRIYFMDFYIAFPMATEVAKAA